MGNFHRESMLERWAKWFVLVIHCFSLEMSQSQNRCLPKGRVLFFKDTSMRSFQQTKRWRANSWFISHQKKVMLVISDLFILSDEAISLLLKKPRFYLEIERATNRNISITAQPQCTICNSTLRRRIKRWIKSGGFSHILASITDTSRDSRLASTYGHVPSSQGMRLSWLRTASHFSFLCFVWKVSCSQE